jgi:hypothetical protein
MIFSFCRRVNDRVIRYRSLAVRACNLVFHILFFLGHDNLEISGRNDSLLQFEAARLIKTVSLSELYPAQYVVPSTWYLSIMTARPTPSILFHKHRFLIWYSCDSNVTISSLTLPGVLLHNL